MSSYKDDQFVGHSLRKYGEYSEQEVALWRKLIKEGDSVVDIGANIGALTVPLATLVGESGHVFALEPQPENYVLLKLNTASHDNIIADPVALGARDGTIKVRPLSALPHTNYGGVQLGGSDADEDVPLMTLDTYYAADRIAFIKLDVEGMEVEVLRGGQQTINKSRPILYVENDDYFEKSEEMLQMLHGSMNYRVYEHKPWVWSADNFRNAPLSDNVFVSNNVLCVPVERVQELDEVTRSLRMLVPRPIRKVVSNKGWACIVRFGGVGDDLIAASALRPLKRMGYMTEVISQEPQCCIFENNPFLDKLTIKDSKREVPQGDPIAWQKYWWARSQEYDKFTNLSHTVEVLLAQFTASSAFWWPAKKRRQMCGQSYLEAAHDVADVPYEFGPLFFPTADEQDDIRQFKDRHRLNDKPLVAWCVCGTRIDKLYPWSAMVVARMIKELDVNVLLLSAPHPRPDGERAKQIIEHTEMVNGSMRGIYDCRSLNLEKPEWPIRRILTLAQLADLVIGPDTGPMWAVALEPVRKIMLHSHASVDNITKHWLNTISLAPASWVRCWPCHLLHDGHDTCQEMQMQSKLKPKPDDKGAACISSINVERVIAAAQRQLTEVKDGNRARCENLSAGPDPTGQSQPDDR